MSNRAASGPGVGGAVQWRRIAGRPDTVAARRAAAEEGTDVALTAATILLAMCLVPLLYLVYNLVTGRNGPAELRKVGSIGNDKGENKTGVAKELRVIERPLPPNNMVRLRWFQAAMRSVCCGRWTRAR